MFSITMLTWNNFHKVERCLSTMTPLILDERVEEVIILDNGSHEIALQKLLKSIEKNYSKIRVIYSSENLGIASGRKYLYDLCKGEYILSFDSDVQIINTSAFIENFLNAIKLKDMMLVGGGGGNHVFWPTIFRTDINNLPSPEKINQVSIVDEVAGWFHGFSSKLLKKNGGLVYMDDQFSPFWGEDSDFCYQIKTLGGKCCILGQGNLAHAWSSCDKKENHGTIEEQWKKMTDKWYPTFGEQYKLDFNSKFYADNYPEHKDAYNITEKYLLEGMKKGHVINKEHIKKLFDVKFESTTSLTYENKKYHTREFIDKFFNRDNIVSNNYKVVENNLKDDPNAFYIYIDDKNKGEKYLTEELIKVRSSAVIVIVESGVDYEKIQSILKSVFSNYYLAQFINYYDYTIPFVISLGETSNFKFGKMVRLRIDKSLTNDMKFEKSKNNAYAIDLTADYLAYKPIDYFSKDGLVMEHEKLLKIISSYPFKEILEIALRLPTKYSLQVSPRFCPKHSLEKCISTLENHKHINKALILYLTKVEDSERVKNNTDKLKESGNCDVVILNIGEEKFWSVSELGFDYYFTISENEFFNYNYFSILSILHLYDYSNVVMMNDNFKIEKSLEEFFKHSYYHNISFLHSKENPITLLSFISEDFQKYAGMVQQIKKVKDEGKDINMVETIEINTQKAFLLKYLWKETRAENDEQIEIEYTKINEKFEDDEDFSLLIDE